MILVINCNPYHQHHQREGQAEERPKSHENAFED